MACDIHSSNFLRAAICSWLNSSGKETNGFWGSERRSTRVIANPGHPATHFSQWMQLPKFRVEMRNGANVVRLQGDQAFGAERGAGVAGYFLIAMEGQGKLLPCLFLHSSG